jgi:hypothetical protein
MRSKADVDNPRQEPPFRPLNLILALRFLTSATRWSPAVAAPLRSMFDIVSATQRTALDFWIRLLLPADCVVRINADAA